MNVNRVLKEILDLDYENQVSAYCDLNCWNWPESIIKLKPDWWENNEQSWTKESQNMKLNILRPLCRRLSCYVDREDSSIEHMKRHGFELKNGEWERV